MIAAWMLYSALTAALLGCAALIAERGLLGGELPTRWVWIVALGGSLGASAVGWLLPGRAVPSPSPGLTPVPAAAPGAHPGHGTERPADGGFRVSSQRPLHDDALDIFPPAISPFDELVTRARSGDESDTRRVASSAPRTGEAAARAAAAPGWLARASTAPARWIASVPRDARLDGALATLWLIASLLLFVRIGRGDRDLRRLRRSWREETIDGVGVLVSRAQGPAVVGFRRGRVVLPEWAFRIDGDKRSLLLAHELEHLRAGDHRLIIATTYALAVVPWNLPLWWQLRRLRHAIELDCDARVLGRAASADAYGSLLLEVAIRRSPRLLRGTAFADPASYLERRVRALLRRRQPGWRAGLGARSVVSFATALLALGLPRPAVTGAPVPARPVPAARVVAGASAAAAAMAERGSADPSVGSEPLDGGEGSSAGSRATLPSPPSGVDPLGLGVGATRVRATLRRDSAGIEIVETDEPAWDAGGRWRLSEDPILSVGRSPAGVGGPDVFGAVTGALRLPDGTIVVADGDAGELRYFDASGRFRLAVGGIGEGRDRFEPGGEFRRSPYELRQCGDGRIYAIDPFRRRVSVWNALGGFQRAFEFLDPEESRERGRVPPGSVESALYPYGWACTADGGFVAGSWSWQQEVDSGRTGPSLYEARASVWVLDSVARPALDLGEHRLAERVALSTPERSWTDAPHPLGRSVAFAGDGESTFVAAEEGLGIHVHDGSGALVRILRAPAEDLSITGEILEGARAIGPGWSRSRIFLTADSLGIPPPAALPGLTRILLDPAGNLWVRRFQMPWEASERWGVFARDGGFLGHLVMPDGFAVHEVGAEGILGVHTDGNGVQRVRLYGITRST